MFKLEPQNFVQIHKIDIALISETHFTTRPMFKIPYYKVYHVPHPDGTAHGGAAVVIRSEITHHELLHHQSGKIQVANIQVDANPWPFTISAIYCPPRHAISAKTCLFAKPLLRNGCCIATSLAVVAYQQVYMPY
jgi:hypothetical protein